VDLDPYSAGSGSESRRANMTNKSEEISSFEVLNTTFKDEVFSGCLGISKLQFLIKKVQN
jgi:hypothetical protein